MFTRCPECQCLYRLTPEQLKVARGKVRCGNCTTVFDALESLVEQSDSEKGEETDGDEPTSDTKESDLSDPDETENAAAGSDDYRDSSRRDEELLEESGILEVPEFAIGDEEPETDAEPPAVTEEKDDAEADDRMAGSDSGEPRAEFVSATDTDEHGADPEPGKTGDATWEHMFFDDDHGIPDADLRVADPAHAGVPHGEGPNAPEPATETDQSSTAGDEEQSGAVAARTEEPGIGDSVAVARETATAEAAATELPEAKKSETAAAETSRSRNFLQRLWGGRKSAKATPVSPEVAELFDAENAAEPEVIDLVGTEPDALETAVEEDVARLFTGDSAAPDAEIEPPDDAEAGAQDATAAKPDATDEGGSERPDADEAPDLRHVHGSSLAAELDVDHEVDRATEAPEDEPEELPDLEAELDRAIAALEDEPEELPDLEEELDRAIEALEDDSDETPDREDEGDALDEDFAGVFEGLETVDWDEDSPAEAAASIEEHRGEEARTDSAAPAADAGESLLDDILRENEQRDEPREVIAEASGIRVQLLDESDLGDVDEKAWESLSAKLGLGPERANAEEESAAPIEDTPAAVDKTDDAAAAAEADELETDTDEIYQSFVASTAPAATAANPELVQMRAAPEDDAQAPKRATMGAAPFPGSPPPRARRWLLLLATLLMAILLVAQLVHARRDALLQDPTFGPRLRATYAAFGYELPPDWDLTAYDLRQLDAVIAPQTPDVIRIKISLRNRADRAQPYPVVRLVLIDTWGEPIGQRDLLPSQYLGSAPPPLLGPGERVTGEIAVADPKDGTATSFEIDACLSMGPAGLECAGAR